MSSKTGKFSTRQWLNLIILMISAMFLLMVLLGRMMNPEPAITDESVINVSLRRIDFEGVSIWYEQGEWRSSSAQLSTQKIHSVLEQWQQLINRSGEPFTGSVPAGKTVLLYFTQMPQPVICKVSLMEQQLRLTFVNSQQQFVFDASEYELFYPVSIPLEE